MANIESDHHGVGLTFISSCGLTVQNRTLHIAADPTEPDRTEVFFYFAKRCLVWSVRSGRALEARLKPRLTEAKICQPSQ
ncbi:Phosphatidylinositol-glycan-specific phospholipase D [Dissostichus eleginoides]|uniref:Phosphatidylinositol-glycan-specific phospholipase D n=1 Tax=Dissostichus eleginoides TaxID=100907 RepID=A0AAD9BVM3_DISEL|nr:Phosphatidylinositol-glycan-specific phospholipase D [Dissostichus eleginoides]